MSPDPADKVAHRAAGEHFAGAGHCADSCPEVDSHAAPLLSAPLAYSDMQADPDRILRRPYSTASGASSPFPARGVAAAAADRLRRPLLAARLGSPRPTEEIRTPIQSVSTSIEASTSSDIPCSGGNSTAKLCRSSMEANALPLNMSDT